MTNVNNMHTETDNNILDNNNNILICNDDFNDGGYFTIATDSSITITSNNFNNDYIVYNKISSNIPNISPKKCYE